MNASAFDPDPVKRWRARIEPAAQSFMRGFHRYANWLVSISWKKFVLLSLLLLILTGIAQNLPPFSWRITETVLSGPSKAPVAPPPPPVAKIPPLPKIVIQKPASGSGQPEGVDISIDASGVRVTPRAKAPAVAPTASAADASPAAEGGSIVIRLPKEADSEDVRQALEEARQALEEAAQAHREAAEAAAQAARETADQARADAADNGGLVKRTRTLRWGDSLPELALLWIVASAIIKATYKGRIQAEAKAAQATEVAESESLKRQVVEARMAAMQAQVEPHFLFNTLASIEHLIETDPARASQMQRNLIALLRASMPTMREANASGVRDLGREVAVIRPYLEILKVRMEERLATEIDIPEGLHSAEFPPMMIQSLVENAIKHGLEPKPEGGTLNVKAQIVHGKLQITVADTGVGFGRAATAGTGVGLANIRERLQMLYGARATLTVAANQPSGTIVTITVPYRTIEGDSA